MNKHVVFITPGFPKNEEDTTCIPALQFYAKALKEDGVKISVVSIHYPFQKDAYLWHGIEVFPLNGQNKKFRTRQLRRKALQKVKDIHDRDNVDVIHSFWLHETTRVASAVSKSLNIPLIATAMGQEMRNPKPSFKRWKKSDFTIVALSDFQADALRKKGVEPSAIVPWGIHEVTPVAKTTDLICVANLIPLKNVKYFVAICAEIVKTKPDLIAKIVGDGPLASNLQNQISDLGIQENVELLGELTYEESQTCITTSQVLIHPSQFEGFGMVIIEALAAGTHVIANPVGIAQQLEIPFLTGNVSADAAMVQVQLKSASPEPIVFDIKDTVSQYKSIYGF